MQTWYIARGAGLAALVVLSAATALGAGSSARLRSVPSRVVLQYLHRSTAALGLGLLVIHVFAILADSYAGVGWIGALVPFSSGYRPLLVTLGCLSAYLFLIVSVMGAVRGRLAMSVTATRRWRAIHLISYAAWALSVLHGFTIGSDSALSWTRWLYAGCAGLVLTAIAARLISRRDVRTSGVLTEQKTFTHKQKVAA